jgi:hypothetical protein
MRLRDGAWMLLLTACGAGPQEPAEPAPGNTSGAPPPNLYGDFYAAPHPTANAP